MKITHSVLVLVADVVWAINFIIDDWYLMVRWFAHRRAVLKQRCFVGRDVFCRFSFMASLAILRSLFIMALFGHKLCTYKSEFQLELQCFLMRICADFNAVNRQNAKDKHTYSTSQISPTYISKNNFFISHIKGTQFYQWKARFKRGLVVDGSGTMAAICIIP